MHPTRVERLILFNQYKILERLDPENADSYQKMQEILENGYELEYQWKTEFITDDRDVMSTDQCRFVINVLSMYEALQRSYDRLSNKGTIEPRMVEFPGFDGNHEPKYLGYTRFLINREEKFTYLRTSSDDLNSHFRTLERYRRMLAVWRELGESYDLTSEQIQAILNAPKLQEA